MTTTPKYAGAGLADQIICSAGNFLAFVLVARSGEPANVGIYGVMVATITIASGIQNALLTGPIRVLGAGLRGTGQADYLRATTSSQIALALILAAIVGSAAFIKLGMAWAVVASLACMAQLFQQYARAVGTVTLDMRALLLSDGWTHGVRLVGIVLLAITGHLDALSGIVALAIGSIAGTFVTGRLRFSNWSLTRRVAKDNWVYGRWLLVETMAFYASTHLYLILVAGLLGAAAAGVFGALQNLFNVVNVFVTGICNVAPTIARRHLVHDGVERWRRTVSTVAIGCVGFALTAVALIVLAGDEILGRLYGASYVQGHLVLATFAIAYVLSAGNTVVGMAFRTIERPDVGAMAKVLSGCAAVLAAPLLLSTLGIMGAVLGLVATQIIWLGVYGWSVSRGVMSDAAMTHARERARMHATSFNT